MSFSYQKLLFLDVTLSTPKMRIGTAPTWSTGSSVSWPQNGKWRYFPLLSIGPVVDPPRGGISEEPHVPA